MSSEVGDGRGNYAFACSDCGARGQGPLEQHRSRCPANDVAKLRAERGAARAEAERLRAAVIAFATGLVVDNDAAWRALEKLLRTVAADGPGPGATT